MRGCDLVLAVTLAGCWTSSTASSEPHPTTPTPVARTRSPCEETVDHTFALSRPRLEQEPELAGKLDAIRAATVASCVETAWTDEAHRCFRNSPTFEDLAPCGSNMTYQQNRDLARRIHTITNPDR